MDLVECLAWAMLPLGRLLLCSLLRVFVMTMQLVHHAMIVERWNRCIVHQYRLMGHWRCCLRRLPIVGTTTAASAADEHCIVHPRRHYEECPPSLPRP